VTLLRIVAAGLFLSFIGYLSPAVAGGGFGSGDSPWNPEHYDRLPAEVRKAVSHLCGSLQAGHYFATYSENSRLLNLHFEHSHCEGGKSLCTQAGCPHQVYALSHGQYRLVGSYYRSGND
jgi:hypothetical protein